MSFGNGLGTGGKDDMDISSQFYYLTRHVRFLRNMKFAS